MPDPEVDSFKGLWPGGYFEGDPLDRHARSHYGAIDVRNGYVEQPGGLVAQQLGYVSVLYAVYLLTIRNRLPPAATVLEIGPGRGGWTKALLTQNPNVHLCPGRPSSLSQWFLGVCWRVEQGRLSAGVYLRLRRCAGRVDRLLLFLRRVLPY